MLGSTSNSSHVGDDHPVGDYSLAELQRNVRESELLRKIAVKANEAATTGEAIQACLDEVCAYTGWPVGHAYMPTADGTGELGSTKLWHIDDPERYETFRRVTETTHYTSDQGLPSRVMAEAAPQWMVSDTTYQHFPRANARIEAGLKSGFAFPAMVGKTVVAVLEYFSLQAIEPDPQFLTVTAEIGILIGQVIERKQAEELRFASEARLAGIVDIAPEAVISIDVGNRIGLFNQGAEAIFGYTADEITGQPLDLLLPTRFREGHGQRIEGFLRSPGNSRLMGGRGTIYGLRKDGTEFPAEASISKLELPEETILTVILRDITDRAQAETALRASETRYRQLAELSPDGMYVHVDGEIVFANSSLAKILAYPSPEGLLGTQAIDLPAPEHRAHILGVRAKVMGGEVAELEQSEFLRFDGSRVPVERTATLVSWDNTPAVLVLLRDITERQDSEERFRQMAENISEVFWMTDPAKNEMIYISPAYELIWGRSCQSLYENALSFVEAIHPEDRERVVKAFEKQQRGDYDEEYRIIRPDGTVRQIRDRAFPIKNEHDEVYRVVGIAEDITEDRRRDEQLTQAQKMQAVGQLTGGVAHDFNNLLAVILGNAELLGDKIGDDQLLASISRAGTRGAELTQRLLSFSRQQTLTPQSIDLTELVPGLYDLLHRTLGEPVKIVTNVPEDIWPVLADPGQLENALLNLSINARDAMPGGGILEIRCSNIELQEGDLRVSDEVAAGDYVQIAVLDTGHGMPEDALEHAFEPFYTTKDVGEGTGLGLSMVYGFARQSGGDAAIESTPGMGAEVKIFLPRSEVTTASDERTQDDELKRGQGEVILVLEDDPDVRSLAVAILGGLGYRVLEAADANAAMRILEEEADNIDLLLSDVVLPGGISGPEFATKAKDLYPKLKIVFMTGYASGLDATDRIPDIGEAVLNKPFRRADLATVIHDTLTT